MTTLTLRVNLYDKTIQPALASEPEAISVGETVKLRLLGTGFTADDITAINTVIASDAVTPPLRARMRNDAMGDIAIFPFPGDDLSQGNGWFAEDVYGETAICCNIDLGTAQAYGLFGGVTLPDGVSRKIRLIVERSFPNENPTLFASDLLRVGSWSFPGHELRFIGHPKETDVSIDDVQELVNGAVAAFQNEVSGVKETLVEQASAIANAITSGSGDASGLIEALSGHFATKDELSGVMSGVADAVASGLSGVVMSSGAQTITGIKTFESGFRAGTSGNCPVTPCCGGYGLVIGSGGTYSVPILYWGEESDAQQLVTVALVESGLYEVASAIGLEHNWGYGGWVIPDGFYSGCGMVYTLSGIMSGLGIEMYSGSDGSRIPALVAGIVQSLDKVADISSKVTSMLGLDEDPDKTFCEAVDDCICGWKETVEHRLSGLEDDVSDHETRIQNLGQRVGALETDVNDLVSDVGWLLGKAAQAGWGSPDDESGSGGGGDSGDSGEDPIDPPFPPPIV